MNRRSIISGIAALMLSGCAPKMYRVCSIGAYTGDKICGKPQPKSAAKAEVRRGLPGYSNIKLFIERAHDNRQIVYEMRGK